MPTKKLIPCGSREAIVTVFSYSSGNMNGYLQHPGLRAAKKFSSLSELMLLIEQLLDMEDCPGGLPLPLVWPEHEKECKKAVFRIDVLFRDHHTWQGRLVWETENREAVFQSVLELMQLMDEILEEG